MVSDVSLDASHPYPSLIICMRPEQDIEILYWRVDGEHLSNNIGLRQVPNGSDCPNEKPSLGRAWSAFEESNH